MGTTEPEFNQEFVLRVPDANHAQLEVTLWDGKEQRNSSGFMGECILNLSKLVPFQGHIIEQDFDVKPGKQYKTKVPASGKLMLQLEFTASKDLHSDGAPSESPAHQVMPAMHEVSQSDAARVQSMEQGPFGMNITVVEARDVCVAHSNASCLQSYACISLICHPEQLEHHHYLMLDHGVEGSGTEGIRLPPLHFSRPITVGAAGETEWNEPVSLFNTHPDIKAIELLTSNGHMMIASQRVPLDGHVVLMLVTVHDPTAQGDGFAGRVLIPQVHTGEIPCPVH